MALRLDNLENLKDREQDYKDAIHHLQSNLHHLAHESEKKELQLTAKLEHSIREMEQNFVKLQEETDMQCSELRDERDLAMSEFQRVLQEYENQNFRHTKELEEAVSSRSEEMSTLEGQLLSLQNQKLKNEDELQSLNQQLTHFRTQAEDDRQSLVCVIIIL